MDGTTAAEPFALDPSRNGVRLKRALTVALLVILLPASAAQAKGGGRIEVMTPHGRTFVISKADAQPFWEDWLEGRCVSCRAPKQTAILQGKVDRAFFRDGERVVKGHLLLTGSQRGAWWRAWLVYPSTAYSPAYVVMRADVGDRGMLWDAWQEATPAMESVILKETGKLPKSQSGSLALRQIEKGAVSVDDDRPGIWPWIAGSALLVSAVVLGQRRRPHFS